MPWEQTLTLAERLRSEDLEVQGRECFARMAAKCYVADDLLGGRISLAEATGRYHDLCADPPHLLDIISRYERGRTEEERLCRHVIRWMGQTALERGLEVEEVNRRLEAQLAAYLEHYGTVPLP